MACLACAGIALLTGATAPSAAAERRAHSAYEPPDPTPDAGAAATWDSVSAGLHGALGSLDVRYPRNAAPGLPAGPRWSASGWRGERVSAQFVLWSIAPVSQLRLDVSPLRSASGGSIAASARFVRYVLADTVLAPDILDDAKRLDMPERTARPVWVSVDIPSDAAPGIYEGTLSARGEGTAVLEFPLRIEVLPLDLPAPRDWSFHLDLWQNPYAVARYHHVTPWSPEHFALLRPLYRMLADAGQKCLTTTIIDAPWGGQTYDPYGSMVGWTKAKDGAWRFDYTAFDRYVRFARECGLDGWINCYSMVPWTNSIRYYDEARGESMNQEIRPDTDDYERMWAPFLKDFTAHLKRKGWLSRTVMAMDERPWEMMKPAIAMLHRYGPGLRLALAGDNEPRVQGEVNDWSVIINSAISEDMLRSRSERGALTTFYVCTGPERPNTFTYSPPAEAAWMGLYAAARHMDGFLRWAYDCWVEDPLWDTKHVTWQSGDCFLVYPGPRSSIRFERLREGIQQYEKVRLLRERCAGRNHPELAALESALKGFTFEQVNAEPAAEAVNRAEAAIEALSRAVTADRPTHS
jgi:hypothetical protein